MGNGWTEHSRWYRAGPELLTRGRVALADGAREPSRTGLAAVADRGRKRTGGVPREASRGAARGWAMWHYLQRGVGNVALPTNWSEAAGAAGTPQHGSVVQLAASADGQGGQR